jgi:hypothetical protein
MLLAFASDPVDYISALISGKRSGGDKNQHPSGMVPLLGADFRKLIITRSRTDGLDASACGGRLHGGSAPSRIGSLAASDAESGERMWQFALPVSWRVREALSAANASELRPVDVVSTMAVTRPRPLRSHHAELMIVESLRITAPTSGSAEFLVVATFVDAETGVAVGEASYIATAPVEGVVRTPVLHVDSQREVFAIVHIDGSVRLMPGTASVLETLALLQVCWLDVAGTTTPPPPHLQ